MKYRFLKVMGASLLSMILYINVVSAALIEHNGYSRNDTTSIVFGPTSQWLTFDVTAGKSIDWYLEGNASTLLGGGWRLASNNDVLDLFNDLFANPWLTWDATETFDAGVSTVRPEYIDATDWFVSLFGVTKEQQFFDGVSIDTFSSYAYYGSDLDSDDLYKRINVRTGDINYVGNFFGISLDRHRRDETDTGVGLVLVRDLDFTPPVQAPEPAMLVIVALGLLVLASRQLQK